MVIMVQRSGSLKCEDGGPNMQQILALVAFLQARFSCESLQLVCTIGVCSTFSFKVHSSPQLQKPTLEL